MNRRRQKARLDQLERATPVVKNEREPAPTFVIDPAMARSLRDDCERKQNLGRRVFSGAKLSAAEMEESSRLSTSIRERAHALDCPASYEGQQDWDRRRVENAARKRRKGIPLTEAEDAEEAQARTRLLAYAESQMVREEGLNSDRKGDLKTKAIVTGLTAAEQQELDDLCRRYPKPGDITDDPTFPAILAVTREILKENPEFWHEREQEYRRECAAVKRKDE